MSFCDSIWPVLQLSPPPPRPRALMLQVITVLRIWNRIRKDPKLCLDPSSFETEINVSDAKINLKKGVF